MTGRVMRNARLRHASCEWEQRGPCVWCAEHDVPIYQGTVALQPETRRAIEAMFQETYKLLTEREGHRPRP